MHRDYTPADWYWLADDGRIFSSAWMAIVDVNDGAYIAWAMAGGCPTTWPRDDAGVQTDAALQDVLRPHRLYVDLAALKSDLKAEIDMAAERERLKYITAGAGQAMEYQQAAAEANALLAALATDPQHEPDPQAYPMLAASIGLDGETLIAVATTVATMHRQWQTVVSAIRAARLAAKKAIDEAQDEAAARAVQPDWPSA